MMRENNAARVGEEERNWWKTEEIRSLSPWHRFCYTYEQFVSLC